MGKENKSRCNVKIYWIIWDGTNKTHTTDIPNLEFKDQQWKNVFKALFYKYFKIEKPSL